ncbi:MAG: DNA polymerase III subunit chi [Gammaproteobacteria bacterium]
MTRVDFYVANDDAARVACRLAEKAWKLGHKVYVHTKDPTDAQKLDELMWTFRDVAFVPHSLTDEGPVRIGHAAPPDGFDSLLVNLADEVPAFFSKFERVAEVVSGDESAKAQARERFRFYRERGYELETHQV